MIRTLLIYLALFSASQVYGECRKYLSVYPTNYNFNNSKKILEAWEEENRPLLEGCDELLSTEQAKIILNEVNLDFYVYYGILSLTSNQVEYIRNNTGATHLIKIAQSTAGGDIALIPVVIDLSTRKKIYDFPFNKVSFVRDSARNLLNLDSFSALLSILMTWILPNSFTLGIGYSYFPNLIEEDASMGETFVNSANSGRANLSLYIESIYPPFSFNNFDWQFQAYGSMGFALQFNNERNKNSDAGVNGYYNLFLMANPKLVFQVSFHTRIGSFFANVAPGWAGVYFNDDFENDQLKGVMTLGAGFGYRYFFNRNLHIDWINSGTRFYPELVRTEYVLAKYQLISILGFGYYIPDIYDNIFEWFGD